MFALDIFERTVLWTVGLSSGREEVGNEKKVKPSENKKKRMGALFELPFSSRGSKKEMKMFWTSFDPILLPFLLPSFATISGGWSYFIPLSQWHIFIVLEHNSCTRTSWNKNISNETKESGRLTTEIKWIIRRNENFLLFFFLFSFAAIRWKKVRDAKSWRLWLTRLIAERIRNRFVTYLQEHKGTIPRKIRIVFPWRHLSLVCVSVAPLEKKGSRDLLYLTGCPRSKVNMLYVIRLRGSSWVDRHPYWPWQWPWPFF